tara:strand:+ start:2422 stop:4305 length:1884 start_codon:yes stop_codon:yes gene_type:complete
MSLVNLTTNLKSLRYGRDRQGGGDSGQPYITTPIPESIGVDKFGLNNTGYSDFLLRGGTLLAKNTVDDVSRLTKMFLDLKSPNGIFFTAKQLMLSRSNVKTQASPIAFNNGIYLPTSTVAQAGVNALGIHLNKQGIDPTGLTNNLTGIPNLLTQPSYSNVLKSRVIPLDENRLWDLTQKKVYTDSANSKILYQYGGGPGSILGTVGRTRIDRVSNTRAGESSIKSTGRFKYYNVRTMTYEQISKIKGDAASRMNAKIGINFTKLLTPPNTPLQKSYNNISKTLNYRTQNIEKRVNLGSPGKRGNKSSYVIGKRDENGKVIGPTDKLNALPLYKSEGVLSNEITNDLVKFRIGVIDNDDPSKKTYIHFRAFIQGMNDSYSSKWSGTQFVGRGEELYRYGGFSRSISLSWTVVAQSKQELIPMYQKLNYLASTMAPDYSTDGYMRGNLVSLTIGGWLFEQVGFIEGISYDIPDDSPWEIAIGDGVDNSGSFNDSSVKEMPHRIEVSGFKFTPIQSFVPATQQNTYAGQDPNNPNQAVYEGVDGNFVQSYGKERYIMLSNGGDSENSNSTTTPGLPKILNDNYGNLDGSITGGKNYIPPAPNNASNKNTSPNATSTSPAASPPPLPINSV